jgi:uncharacterized protein
MSLTTVDGRFVSPEVEIADTLLKQIIGLMFRRSFRGAMVFDMGRESFEGIHMMFVFFPIDVVFLDPNKNILDLKKNLRPWTGSAFPKSRFRYAIELPAGTIDRIGLKTGDQLQW